MNLPHFCTPCAVWLEQPKVVVLVVEGPCPAPSAPWASAWHSWEGGGSSLDLGWLSLAQIHTFRKTDLRSCLRETMKHTSSLMSPSSKIKPCSLATAEGSQWWQYLFSFWALRIVLDKRKMCCIARKKELLSMHKRSHRVLMSSALQFTVLYIFTRELISVLLLFLLIDSKART